MALLNGLDLFSGIGGITFALSEWVKPIAYCEIDRYAQAVLLSRMSDGKLPRAPIWDDITTLDGKQFRGQVDIIYGGFPCQDISVAGKGKGLAGKRSGLFSEIMRLAEEIKPKFIFLENVPAIRTRGLNHVAERLARSGYDCRWDFVSAQEVKAPHLRNRWFCLAYANGSNLRDEQGRRCGESRKRETISGHYGTTESLAYTKSARRIPRKPPHSAEENEQIEGRGENNRRRISTSRDDWWTVEPNVGRVVDGLPFRVDRIKGLGNSVVPEQAKEAFMRLMNKPQSGGAK